MIMLIFKTMAKRCVPYKMDSVRSSRAIRTESTKLRYVCLCFILSILVAKDPKGLLQVYICTVLLGCLLL